jgi:hypothetical protein
MLMFLRHHPSLLSLLLKLPAAQQQGVAAAHAGADASAWGRYADNSF